MSPRINKTLFMYIGKQFLMAILYTALGLTLIALLLDAVEIIRRVAGKDGVPLHVVVQMTVLKAPILVERLFPFCVLVGSLLALTRLTRLQELVVARAAGISVWQFLTPALCVVMLLGVFNAMVFNPLASVMLLKFEKLEAKYIQGKSSLLTVSSSGLWLRQVEEDWPNVGEHIIYSLRLSQNDMSFSNLIVFTFDKAGRFIERLDADSAALKPGQLLLKRVTRSIPGRPSEVAQEYALPTNLQMEHIQDSFADPETISFWKLPGFIGVLENAGFSALRHRLYFHSLLASPFLYAGMVLIAAIFSLRLPRFGRIAQLATAGVFTGFFLYFLTDMVNALGMAGTLPVSVAAWAPALIIAMIGAGTLLHLEDG